MKLGLFDKARFPETVLIGINYIHSLYQVNLI